MAPPKFADIAKGPLGMYHEINFRRGSELVEDYAQLGLALEFWFTLCTAFNLDFSFQLQQNQLRSMSLNLK